MLCLFDLLGVRWSGVLEMRWMEWARDRQLTEPQPLLYLYLLFCIPKPRIYCAASPASPVHYPITLAYIILRLLRVSYARVVQYSQPSLQRSVFRHLCTVHF